MLAVCSISLIGFGMMTAVMPLISPEKGQQVTIIVGSILLLISGVYYPIDVLPGWMQQLASALAGHLRVARHPRGAARWHTDERPLGQHLAAAHHRRGTVPAGLMIFSAGERFAKRTGRLKRNG